MEPSKRIFLASPHMSEDGYEMQYIKEAFDTNWIAPLGANVTGFEQAICEKLGCKAAVALSSGTAAIHLALKLLNIRDGDLVFCQDLTFSATINPILYERGIPVFIDSEQATWNMSPEALERAFETYEKKGQRPKAVIAVHLYGLAADIETIREICRKYDTPIIEDAAESLGTVFHGKNTGTFGKFGIISFNGNKIITSSGGGMLLCNTEDSEEKAKKALFWATQAREPERYYQHRELGYNYRMSNIVAGIGRGQLKVLDKRVEQKRNIYRYYEQAFSQIEDISMMPIHDDREYSNCWLSCMTLAKGAGIKPLDIELALEEHNIEARPVWKPMHMQPIFANYDYIDNGGVAQQLFEQGVCLPSDTKMTEEDLERVVKIIKSLWK